MADPDRDVRPHKGMIDGKTRTGGAANGANAAFSPTVRVVLEECGSVRVVDGSRDGSARRERSLAPAPAVVSPPPSRTRSSARGHRSGFLRLYVMGLERVSAAGN